jgi:uncharacterized protein (TIGR02271 family)
MAEPRHNLVPLSTSGYEVAAGEPDPRGWDVISSDGRKIGEVTELIGDTTTRKVRFFDCDLDEGTLGLEAHRHAIIPVGSTRLNEDKEQVFLPNVSSAEIVSMPATISDITAEHAARYEGMWPEREVSLTRAEEELEIGKRQVESGEVDVHKHVETQHVSRPVTRTHEEVEIERRPADRLHAGEAEFRDEEVRVPVREEQIEVRKHPEVKEELIVRTHPVTEEEQVEADLRREDVEVEERGHVEKFHPGSERGRLGRERGR